MDSGTSIKVFKEVIRNHLVRFLDENNKYNLNQQGYGIGRSCLSQLLTHYDRILKKGINVDTRIQKNQQGNSITILRSNQQLG